MEKLLMQVALVDQVTKPLQGITQQVQQTADAGRDGLQQMATGAAGLAATGFAVKSALMPAIEMDRKLGEVKSLGVHEEALQSLQSTALEFSAEYGKSAVEFTGAAYDIQSAIAGLKGDELAQFTKASGVLAAATKSDTATITDYMGTMYGIFKDDAAAMTEGVWVEKMAGMTATAVQMFKTDGSKMSRAFASLGADATSAGIAMKEQMAVLGQLQSTMSGSEAGTKYRAFLAGVGKAQDQLGLKFTDAQGNMLPMIQILEQLKGRYGETLEVAESVELDKAFGSKQATAMLKLLMNDADGLAQNIEKLGQVKGMSQAEQMAAAMTDQWERLESSWFAIRAAAFGAILPSINAIVGSIANGITTLTEWTNQYPLLGEVMGYAAIAALSLGGVVSLLSLAMGIGKFMSAGWAITMSTLGGAMRILRAGMLLMTTATWAMNAALFANPITWIVLAVVALIGAVAAMIYYWDDLKATFGDMAIFQMLGDVIDWVIEKLNMIPGVDIEWRANEMPDMPDASTTQQVEQTKAAEQAAPPVPSVEHIQTKVVEPANDVVPEVVQASQVESYIGVQHEPIQHVVDMPTMPTVPENMPDKSANDAFDSELLSYKNNENIARPPQSVVNNIAGNTRREGDRISQFGDVHIHSEKPMTPQDMAEWEELNVGG